MVKSESVTISNENELKNMFSTKRRNNFYDDQDLKTPGHDKIMDCLIDNAMLSKIANILNLGFKDKRNIQRKATFDENDKWDKKEEFPIKIGYNFKYIDLCATIRKIFNYSEPLISNKCKFGEFHCDNEYIIKEQHDISIFNRNICDYITYGYGIKCCQKCVIINDKCKFSWYYCVSKKDKCIYEDIIECPSHDEFEKYDEIKNLKINIEVKTTIPSIGELIRQINTYRELNNGYYVVITPNVSESLRVRLNNSNIYVIDTEELDIIL